MWSLEAELTARPSAFATRDEIPASASNVKFQLHVTRPSHLRYSCNVTPAFTTSTWHDLRVRDPRVHDLVLILSLSLLCSTLSLYIIFHILNAYTHWLFEALEFGIFTMYSVILGECFRFFLGFPFHRVDLYSCNCIIVVSVTFLFVAVMPWICIVSVVWTVFCMGNVCNSIGDICIPVFGTNTCAGWKYSG